MLELLNHLAYPLAVPLQPPWMTVSQRVVFPADQTGHLLITWSNCHFLFPIKRFIIDFAFAIRLVFL
jgi:hypothetical protein|tara:strand:- start:303 stop:503 length:201 start_codon:yes stop_codon:yes gene_type:complete